ncbi:hypothetical protein LFYK43_07320 [Ligilactobacillus salitolerans]|uniref:Uncharacterized protein n=1 Tax=Ligilactobacillus salitolerans TaxID=1808352 RepID=A0A401IRV9_9LACO|nr:hypothetical protein [Ligilactobacillus salitolerans]GBG94273.1 hypothetical protein LFYK43_07320 [Ligilactobacillus salitolerans]
MPVDLFKHQDLSWLNQIEELEFVGPLLAAQERLLQFDDAAIFNFLRTHGLTYSSQFILSLSESNELTLKTGLEPQFAKGELLIQLNRPNQDNLQNNGTVKQPLTKRQLRALSQLNQEQQRLFNLELNGIYQQLLHLDDLLLDHDGTAGPLQFNYRVYPTVYRYVLKEYHLPENSSSAEKSNQVTEAVNDFLWAALWLRIKGLQVNEKKQPTQVIDSQHIRQPLPEIKQLQLTEQYVADLW